LAKAYAGRILRVNLSTGDTGTVPTARYADRFVGGRGLATGIYWDEVDPEISFDHEDNRLILAVGPLCGAPGGLGGSRWGLFGKSPLPAAAHGGRDHFCYGNGGGKLGATLRYAGYDALIVQGKAERPVTLAIEPDAVTLRPADHLWGLSTVETMARLRDDLGSGAHAASLAIGPAGENRVPLATVFADGDASCSGGMGAVLGAKRLKGITVRAAPQRIPVADRDALRRIDRQIRGYARGNVKVWGLDFMAGGPQTKKSPCHGCMGHCLRVRYTAKNGQRGKFMCQSRFFYMHHAWGYYGEDNDVPFLANRVCDEYGIDTWEVQSLIEWLLMCHAGGHISQAEIGLDLSQVGSLEFIRELVHLTSTNQDFGASLAQGARSAAQSRGGRAAALFKRTDPYDPRYCTVNTLLFPFETREPIQQLHEAGLVLSQWSSWAKGVPEAHIDSEVFRGIAERFWGDRRAAEQTTLDGKAQAATRIQDRQLAKECLGVCDWMFPLIDVPRGPDHVGDPTFESRILSALLGVDYTERDLRRVGERVFNVQRAILLREGHRARDDDFLPDEWHDNPIDTHVADPDLLAPGPGGAIVSQLGRRVDRQPYLRLRDEYYERRGWDVATGLPSEAGLRRLNLGDVAFDLARRNLAVPHARATPATTRLEHLLHASTARARSTLRGAFETVRSLVSPLPAGVTVPTAELERILIAEQRKFGLASIRHNFAGWTKTMQYHFPDLDTYYVIRFVNGEAHPPERLATPLPRPEISYEMTSATLRALSTGELSGEHAYLRRRLRIKAPFADLLALQSLNKVPAPEPD